MIETLILIGAGAFVAGAALGWWLAQRAEKAHVQEISIDEAMQLIEYLQARNRHPSNYRFRHPEMEEEDDC